MTLDSTWFTEASEEHGAAFSLQINKKLHDEQTPFQHIEIYETKSFGNLMVIDGCIMLTDRDNFIYHEMLSHPALFTHPDPRKVLIIGGGDCGTLREVLKHDSVKEVVQIEIDERVTRLAEEYFPALCSSNGDARAQLMFEDGIKWVEEAEAESIDLIIIDSTDPIGPAEGLFSEPFYRQCHRVLRKNGILVQQSESPLFHMKIINDMRAAMKRAKFNGMLTLNFPQCCYPSGWWSATLAGKSADLSNPRADNIADKHFETRYYNFGTHQAAAAYPEFFHEALE